MTVNQFVNYPEDICSVSLDKTFVESKKKNPNSLVWYKNLGEEKFGDINTKVYVTLADFG